MVAQVCNPSTQKVRRSEVQGHPQLYSEYEASLHYRRLWIGTELEDHTIRNLYLQHLLLRIMNQT